jgi:hypothetical protein
MGPETKTSVADFACTKLVQKLNPTAKLMAKLTVRPKASNAKLGVFLRMEPLLYTVTNPLRTLKIPG